MCAGRVLGVVALVGVLLGEPDEIEQVLSNLFCVRRGLLLFAPAPQWASGAVNAIRPNRDGVSVRPVVRVICAIGKERVRYVQSADVAMARNVIVEVRTEPLSPERTTEPARTTAVRAAVGHRILPCRVGTDRLRARSSRAVDGSDG